MILISPIYEGLGDTINKFRKRMVNKIKENQPKVVNKDSDSDSNKNNVKKFLSSIKSGFEDK